MGIVTNDNFNVNAPKNIDDRYSVGGVTPYASVAAANAAIAITRRAIGLTVNIAGVEYWYQAGITDPDLVIKTTGGGGGGGGGTGDPGGSGKIYFLVPSVASDIPGYFTAALTPSTGPTVTIVQANTGTGDTLIASFATPLGDPAVTTLPAGIALRMIHGNVSNNPEEGRYKLEVYKRSTLGVETLLRSGYSESFLNLVPAEISWTYVAQTAATLTTSDRLVFKLYTARVAGPTTCTITSYFEGQDASYVKTTIPTSLANPVCSLQLKKTSIPAVPNSLAVPVNFTHADYSGTIDVITAGVTEFFRDAAGGGIYNIAVESFFTNYFSPENTEWNSVYTDPLNNGHANIQNVTTRVYSDFLTALNSSIGNFILSTPLVMHDLVTNKYYLFTFTQWTPGGVGGGFAYTRTQVIIGTPAIPICDGRITFDDGTWIDTAPVSTGMAIARYVYLVQDASDVTRMGGVAANAYNTFQAAYNAANALQLSLGGSNIVAIIVGNTTAASVGNLVLTANYNQYVQIIGESMNTSFLGSITSTVAGVSINNLFLERVRLTTINLNNGSVTLAGNNAGECFIQSIFTAGGNVSVFNYKFAYINQISTSGASGVASGNILVVSNIYFVSTALQLDAVAANVGSCQLNSNKFVSINFVQMSITGSTLGTETIGVFSMTSNLYAELLNGITMNTNHLSPVATWAGIQINNLGRTSLGDVSVNYNNTAGALASDLVISNLFFQRCDGSQIGVNWQSNTLNPKGGYCTTISIIDCTFSFRIRVGYRPGTAKTNLRVNFDRVTMNSSITGRDLVFYHNSCTFQLLQLINSFSEGSSGFSIQNIGTTSTQMTLTNQMIIRNNVTNALTIVSRNAGATSTVDDVILNGNQVGNLYIEVAQGDMNFSMDQCTSKITRLVASGTATSIKRNIITNSDLNTTSAGITLQGAAPRPKLSLRNSYLNIYTNNASAGTIDVIAYSSFLDTIADVGSVSTYTGNVYTSTVKRLVTDNVAGLTFNASFDQPV